MHYLAGFRDGALMTRADQAQESFARGAMFMCIAMLMASSIDVSVKALTSGYGTAQIVFLRSLLALPVLLAICHKQSGIRALATPRWGWQLWRGLLTAGANFGFFYGIAYIELVTAMMLAYVAPVLIVLLSSPLLGERVGLHQWFGISIAFSGVLVVLQPVDFHFDPAAWAVLGSALCWALLSLSNRKLAGTESPAVLSFYTLPISMLIGGYLMLGHWVTPDAVDLLLFAIAGCSGAGAHFFVAMAYRQSPVGVIAPFEYTTLLWAALAGFLFWGEVPAAWIWLGGLAVVTGGYVATRGRG